MRWIALRSDKVTGKIKVYREKEKQGAIMKGLRRWS